MRAHGGTIALLDPDHKAAVRETLERALDRIAKLERENAGLIRQIKEARDDD